MENIKDQLDFELDFLVFVVLTENPNLSYQQARELAVKELREDLIEDSHNG